MSIIIFDDLIFLFGAVAVLIISVISARNEKRRIIVGAWLLAIGVIETIFCAFGFVFWVLLLSGAIPHVIRGWTFIPDYFGLTVDLPVLLSVGIFSIGYSMRMSNAKKGLESRTV